MNPVKLCHGVNPKKDRMVNKYSLKQGLKQLRNIQPDPLWRETAKKRLLVQLEEVFPIKPSFGYNLLNWTFIKNLKPVAISLLVLVFIFVSGVGVISASKNSLPGQPLYPVKRMVEKAKIYLAFNQSGKTVLRAEILSTRLQEVKMLTEKSKLTKDESKLAAASKDFHQELSNLQKEIIAQTDEDVTFDQGSLPVQDERKVISLIQSEDLKKILEETKEFLAKKDLKAALEKTFEAERITSQPIEQTTSTESIQPKISPQPILKNTEGSLGKIKPPKASDFKIDIQKDSPVKTDLIREK